MRMSLCVRAAVTAGIALAGYMASSMACFDGVGVSSAQAAGFYTRKRVNGVWIEGRFPKSGQSSRRAARPVKSAARTKAAAPAITEVPASAVHTALPPPDPRREQPAPAIAPPVVADVLRKEEPASGLPDVEAALVIAAVGPVPPPDEGGIATEERTLGLRRALQAKAEEMRARNDDPVRLAAPPAPQAIAPEPPQARAPDLNTGAIPGGSVPVQAAPASFPRPAVLSSADAQPKVTPLVPRSVSYDFETGIKTTVFENSVVREPFDRAAMRSLANPR